MAEYKYVMLHCDGRDLPVLFPRQMNHDEMAHATRYALRRSGAKEAATVVSAGFWDSNDGTTHGFSETLQMGPRAGDATLIARGGDWITTPEPEIYSEPVKSTEPVYNYNRMEHRGTGVSKAATLRSKTKGVR